MKPTMSDKEQIFRRVFICKGLNDLSVSSPCTRHTLSPLGQLESTTGRGSIRQNKNHLCPYYAYTKKFPYTSLYTRSTVWSTVPAGNKASSSAILKPHRCPSFGAKSPRMASLFSISHNPYSIETCKMDKQIESYMPLSLHILLYHQA